MKNYGAHEVMEVHEVLTAAIDAIHASQLVRPHIQDPQLAHIADHQLQFMIQEYNQTVNLINQQGMGQSIPYRAPKNFQPKYGLDNPGTTAPNQSMQQLDDRDISSMLLCNMKASATAKMVATLECADPQLRTTMQQSAINCAEMSYELWQYMNEKGYYQIPTLKDTTQRTMMHTYGTTNGMQMGMTGMNAGMNVGMGGNMMNQQNTGAPIQQ